MSIVVHSSVPTYPVSEVALNLTRELTSCGFTCDFVVRAPGRVNLIGEHIDYNHYSVLPMALEQAIHIAVAKNSDASVFLSCTETEYENKTVSIKEAIEFGTEEPPSVIQWFHYPLCAFRGIADYVKENGLNWQPPNIVLLVGGTRFGGLWPAAGLSSSSALVVASAIAVMHASGLQIDRLALADLCARCERYIGIQGGGMDQAASLLGTEGCAILVEFTKPFVTVHPVPLPLNLVFVVAHSGVHARKAATSMYNQRVSECRIASKILTKNSPRPNLVHDAHPLCLQDAQHAWGLPKPGLMLTKGNSTLPSVVDRFLKPGALTRDDIAAILDDDEIDACLVPSTANMEKFHLLARAVHVYSEAERTMQFYQLCRSFSVAGDTLDTPELPRQLGDLMNESHQSCDSMYDCSCPALNELTSVCRSGGALGSRLTGAGWGGSTVSLIPKDKVADFIEHLRRGYYEKRDLECDSLVFVSRPGPPAGIMRIS